MSVASGHKPHGRHRRLGHLHTVHVAAHELSTQADRYDTLWPGREGLEDFVRGHLSPEHRDRPGTGRPSAALLDEISRSTDGTKQATQGATAIVEEIRERPHVHRPTGATAPQR
ncbi:hypothetical protein SLINC_0681 [Streptomyces lincolnensis]|uniref:Uncharacterized protein n=1 Tax=Streptomyces lincolnensis TaxID=1915 RepID=A0A1B1M2M9_STRLN|nr:hypothetical protein SLINC_0681 [Streptomyces lincolnensis]AXG51829.1 hypothetical protein SLCG_0674 [Streptomyces lincolnensis]